MTVTYTTRYSGKRKTLGLIVERDRSVVVLAPNGTGEETIQQFVEKKKLWLFEKIYFSPKLNGQKQELPFVSGKTILYLGKNYKLEIVSEAVEPIAFKGRFLIARNRQSVAKEILEGWYKERAREKIIPLVKRYATKMGVEYNDILVSDLKYTWGSCTLRGNLNFNWRLIKAPAFVINYVVIHELAHLLELNHSDRFWNIVSVQMPNYQEAKAWLKENGEEVF